MNWRAPLAWAAVLVVCFVNFASAQFTIGLNFQGTHLGTNPNGAGGFVFNGFIPPDTMGSVGPTHVVEIINGSYSVYDKFTGGLITRTSLNSFWSSAGAAATGTSFDPRIVYDSFSNRYFAAAVDNASAANNFLVAVSNTSNPLGGWTGFKIDSDTDNNRWADFPMLGVNANGVYVAANMFGVSSSTSTATGILVLPKVDLLAPVPTVVNRTLFQDISGGATGFSVQPVFNQSNTATPQTLLSRYNSTSLAISRIQGSVFAPALDTSLPLIGTANLGAPTPADQPGPKVDINTGDTRFSGNVILRNGSLWGVQTVDIGGRAAIRWFELSELGNSILQTGVISDPILEYYFPSIAVNDDKDVVIGFSGSSNIQPVSAYAIAGSTLAGVTSFASAPTLLFAGVSDYQLLDTSGRNRWGDYSATVIDPSNPNKFWTFQEYVSATDVWSVRVVELTLASIPEPGQLVLLIGAGFVAVVVLRRRSGRLELGT